MNIRKIFLPAAMVLLLASCLGESAKVRSIANNFISALAAEDFDEAMKWSTAEGKMGLEALKTLGQGIKGLSEEAGETYTPSKPSKHKIHNITIDDDSALVTYSMEGETKPQVLEMVKVDGEWKVEFKKNF